MKLNIPKFLYSTFFFLLVPVFAFADTKTITLDKILKAINKEIINPAIIAIFAVALAVFIFGVVRFIWAKQEGGAYEKDGKSHMVWGLVGMFIMASAFGIIQFIANTLTLDFKINNDGSITDPNGEEVTPPPIDPNGGGVVIPPPIDPNGNGGNNEKHFTREECEGQGGVFIEPWYCNLSDH